MDPGFVVEQRRHPVRGQQQGAVEGLQPVPHGAAPSPGGAAGGAGRGTVPGGGRGFARRSTNQYWHSFFATGAALDAPNPAFSTTPAKAIWGFSRGA